MKKFLAINILAIFALVITMLPQTALAATNDFTADADIVVTGITLGSGTVDMLIFNGSTAESWTVSSGVFTVTNPGSYFRVGSTSGSVGSITRSQSTSAPCYNNLVPGTTYVELTSDSHTGTYTITPYVAACANSVIIAPVSSGGGGGGGGGSSSTNTTYQVSDPYNTLNTQPTTTPSATTSATPVKVVPSGDENLGKVLAESATIANGTKEALLASVGKSQDAKAEATFSTTVVKNIVASIKSATAEVKAKITDFVTYGTPTTQVLGAGERGGVVNSFKEAFGKLPATEADWQDVVKIGNGRWPSQTSATRETKAEAAFKAIYKRAPVRTSAKDDAAVVVMAYGLRPANRNLNSEAAASKTFKAVYGKNPSTATDWDTVRAIAYSGAKR